MTGTGTGKEPWDDERLAAAFREAFGVTAPRDLEERVAAAAATGAPPRRPGSGWLRWSGAGASAIAAVAVVVVTVGVLVSNGLPAASPATSQMATGSPSTGGPEPTTAGFPTTIFAVDVLTVPKAIEIRDQGEATEIAVAGWYQQAGPVICPLEPTQQPQLFEGCSLVTQWLMADPETLVPLPDAFVGGPTPSGPAIQPVFEGVEAGWGYPSSVQDAPPRPVVFVGHFHDARAVDCRDENSRVCSERFVVDQVAWVDGSPYDAVFPADVDGIPVWSVEKVLEERDAGELHGIALAVGGWFSADPVSISCPIIPKPWNLFDRTCATTLLVADIPQLANRDRAIVGTGLRLVFAPLWTTRVPAEESVGPVVLVGHFQDPLATSCRLDDQRACAGTFVIDRVAWINGDRLGPRVPPLGFVLTQPAVTQQLVDVARLVREELPADGTVQSMTVLEVQDLTSLDPTALLDLDARAVVWYVRAVERGTNRVGSFIVDDATGDLLWSDFPMGSIVVIAAP